MTTFNPDKDFNKAVKALGCKIKFEDPFFVTISHNESIQRITVDVYKCIRAREVCETVNAAFQVAAEEQRKKKGNPFTPVDDRREAVKGVLFKRQIHRRDLLPVRPIGMGQFGEVIMAQQRVPKGLGMPELQM